MDRSPQIETDLVDLRNVRLDELRSCDAAALAPFLDELHRQVDRPRLNIGSTNPPGRAD